MKVVIDISPLKTGHKTRGIGMYTRRLIEALHKIDKKNQYIVTTKANLVRNADLTHYPYFDLFFHTLPLKRKTKTVVTIHDVIPLIFPKDFPAGVRGKARFFLQRLAIRSVEAIIADSYNSKKDITKYLGIEPEKIHVIHLAADGAFKPQSKEKIARIKKKYALPKKFLLYVGDVNPNKNLTKLIAAMQKVRREMPDIHLVLVGRVFADKALPQVKQILSAIEKSKLSGRVHIRSSVPLDRPETLAAIYSQAKAYIQPSLYEGFGLPILEAFACKTPVVAGKVASIPEVAGEAAIFVDPLSTESIASGIIKAMKLGEKERGHLIEKGNRQNHKFSWEKTARETINVYTQVLAG